VEGRDVTFARWPAYRRSALLALGGWALVLAAWVGARRRRRAET